MVVYYRIRLVFIIPVPVIAELVTERSVDAHFHIRLRERENIVTRILASVENVE